MLGGASPLMTVVSTLSLGTIAFDFRLLCEGHVVKKHFHEEPGNISWVFHAPIGFGSRGSPNIPCNTQTLPLKHFFLAQCLLTLLL